ncbi:MAG: peroxiredoxin, partial [Spirochaetaceae bacterium]|nr:peroxiredoxin [Spirochaetaceae bacterium]
AVVLGISADPVKSHAKFKQRFNLPFHLLSDPDKYLLKAFGAWGYMGIIRSTFVIDSSGIIIKAFPKVKAAVHAQEILALL